MKNNRNGSMKTSSPLFLSLGGYIGVVNKETVVAAALTPNEALEEARREWQKEEDVSFDGHSSTFGTL